MKYWKYTLPNEFWVHQSYFKNEQETYYQAWINLARTQTIHIFDSILTVMDILRNNLLKILYTQSLEYHVLLMAFQVPLCCGCSFADYKNFSNTSFEADFHIWHCLFRCLNLLCIQLFLNNTFFSGYMVKIHTLKYKAIV